MTKAQLALLLSVASALGFAGGTVISGGGTEAASVTFIHALRIEASLSSDGGLGPDAITAYRTSATSVDAGVSLADIGPATCAGETAEVRTWASCPVKGMGSIRVIEFRPGRDAGLDLEVYGVGTGKCWVPRPGTFNKFLDSLKCVSNTRVVPASPL